MIQWDGHQGGDKKAELSAVDRGELTDGGGRGKQGRHMKLVTNCVDKKAMQAPGFQHHACHQLNMGGGGVPCKHVGRALVEILTPCYPLEGT
jgi:hypothetical protein